MKKFFSSSAFLLASVFLLFLAGGAFFWNVSQESSTTQITEKPALEVKKMEIQEFQKEVQEEKQTKVAQVLQKNLTKNVPSKPLPLEKKNSSVSVVDETTENVMKSVEKEEVKKANFEEKKLKNLLQKYAEIVEALAVSKMTEKNEETKEHFAENAQVRLETLEAMNATVLENFSAGLSAELAEKFPEKNDQEIEHLVNEMLAENIAEPNFFYELFGDDPLKKNQWELPFVFNGNITKKMVAGKPVVVAIIDTGIDTNHEDLKGNFWSDENCVDENGKKIVGGCLQGGWDFVGNDPNPFPDDGYTHGTSVAGMVGASTENEKGIASFSGSISSDIQLMSLRSCCTAQGLFEASTIEKAIYFAVNNGANIINMSFGGPTFSEKIQQAIAFAEKNGVLVVAAAGNYASNNDVKNIYPANYDLGNVLSIGALDSAGNVAYFSNYGESVDMLFPGAGVQSTTLGNKYESVNGTSFACPMAAGALAAYLQKF